MSLLEEVFNEDSANKQLNELTQPYSRTQSAINRSKSAVKGLVGGGQYEQGAEQAGQLANRLFLNFKRYIGTKYGKKPSYVTFKDVASFMQQNGMDSKLLGNNSNMTYTPKDVANVFLQAAQEMSSRMGDSEPQQQPQAGNAPQQQQPPAGNAPSTVQPQNNSTGTGSGTLSSLSDQERAQLLSILSKMQ
ncbi:structural protein [Xanthomonas phage XaC1]|nr:structural protein [Xanthomonas phage XaC1]